MLLKELGIPAAQWYKHQNCQAGAKELQGYCSSDLHYTDKSKSTQNRGEAAQLEDQTQQFQNKCNPSPSLDCTLDKSLFTWKYTHDNLLTGNTAAEDVVSCWKDHRAPTPISALVTWRVFAHQLLTVTILVAGQVRSSRAAAHRALGSLAQELPGAPGELWTIIAQTAPTGICQTLRLKAQLQAQSAPPLLPRRVSEADPGEWSLFLPLSVLENLQANPGSFPLEMHFLQM